MRAREKFMAELELLSRKYRIKIAGCGCCGSPYLMPLKKKEMHPDAGYAMDFCNENTGWVSRDDDFAWKLCRDNIIKPPPVVWRQPTDPTPFNKDIWATDGVTVWVMRGDGRPISRLASSVKAWAMISEFMPPPPTIDGETKDNSQ